MSLIRETLFDLVLNASLQIGLFAIVTAVFSRLVAKARAKNQYAFYLTVFLFCLAAPVINTVWQSHPITAAGKSLHLVLQETGRSNHRFWGWQSLSAQHQEFTPGPEVQSWIVAIWGALVLYQFLHFSRGVYRVNRLRRDASILPPVEVGMASQIIEAKRRVALLESAAIDDPITVGVFHPVILLPSKVLPDLGEEELSAVLAHEYGHILRKDYLAHILCEFISLPVAWHPGIRYLMSKISQTRELACDDYAAVFLGRRRLYARALLRLASLCLHTPRVNSAGLGIFDGENLEARIMMLTEKKRSLPRTALIGLVLATSITFGASAVLGRAMSLEPGSASPNTKEPFAGTWHWMFNGKSFATMILVRDGSGFTGSVTPSRIALNDDGGLRQADPSEESAPSPITNAKLEGSALHITVGDANEPIEFIVTLKDETHAQILPKGAPTNMKPIPAEKVH